MSYQYTDYTETLGRTGSGETQSFVISSSQTFPSTTGYVVNSASGNSLGASGSGTVLVTSGSSSANSGSQVVSDYYVVGGGSAAGAEGFTGPLPGAGGAGTAAGAGFGTGAIVSGSLGALPGAGGAGTAAGAGFGTGAIVSGSLGALPGAGGAGTAAGAGAVGGTGSGYVTVISSQPSTSGFGSGAGANSVTVISGSENVSLEASAFSQLEQAILRANNPFEINESETITVNGQTGIWTNKQEVLNWKGVIPITQYVINEDANPEVIRKRTEQVLTYEQEIAIRYLRPPTPPPPGEIVIRQEKNVLTPPAPPLVIRQQPPRPETPAPLVIREAPPQPPAAIGQKVVTISGKRLPPPPRKVIIERLAPLPNKPQSYIIERWLPYSQTKRRVIFQKPTEADPVIPRPRNVIVQWEAPEVRIKKEFKDLGIIRANPVEYVQRYGATLKQHVELPDFVRQIRPPTGIVLAAEYNAPAVLELEGDVQALTLIDLDREGLSAYRAWLARFSGSGSSSAGGNVTVVSGSGLSGSASGSGSGLGGGSGGATVVIGAGSSGASGSGSSTTVTTVTTQPAFNVSISQIINAIIAELFSGIDTSGDARVSVSEAENLVIKLNQRLGRSYTKEEAAAFFKRLDSNRDGQVSFAEFRNALLGQFVSN